MADTADLSTALEILKSVPLIDGHNDWSHLIRAYYLNRLDDRFREDGSLVGHVDFRRLVSGHSGGAFMSTFMPRNNDNEDPDKDCTAIRDTLQQIDLIHRLADRYKSKWEIVYRADDIMQAFRNGKFACLISVEGLHQIADSSSALRMYHRLGVRCMTLVHSQSNMYGNSATGKTRPHAGLTTRGRDMVLEMNRIGMYIATASLIDISHASSDTAMAVMRVSTKPVAYTHSCAYFLAATERNVDDEALDRLKENGGIVMVTFMPELVSKLDQHQTLETVVDHMIYIGHRIGFDHIGIGSDYDGMFRSVRGLEDASCYPQLVREMLRRGISRDDIKKILGMNIIRVLREVEDLGVDTDKTQPVLEDDLPYMWDDSLRKLISQTYPDAS